MEVFVISFVVLVIAVLGMAIGVIFGRTCIKGSCGGLGTIKKAFGVDCSACPYKSREEEEQQEIV